MRTSAHNDRNYITVQAVRTCIQSLSWSIENIFINHITNFMRKQIRNENFIAHNNRNYITVQAAICTQALSWSIENKLIKNKHNCRNPVNHYQDKMT